MLWLSGSFCLNLKRIRGRSSVGKQSRWESYMEFVLSHTHRSPFIVYVFRTYNGTLRSPFENLICSFELNVNMHASPNRKLNAYHKMGSVGAVKVHNYADRILSQWFRVHSRSARCTQRWHRFDRGASNSMCPKLNAIRQFEFEQQKTTLFSA